MLLQNNIILREEWEGSVITYLEEFIKVLDSRKEHPLEIQVAQELRSIHAAGKRCYGSMVCLGWTFCSLFCGA